MWTSPLRQRAQLQARGASAAASLPSLSALHPSPPSACHRLRSATAPRLWLLPQAQELQGALCPWAARHETAVGQLTRKVSAPASAASPASDFGAASSLLELETSPARRGLQHPPPLSSPLAARRCCPPSPMAASCEPAQTAAAMHLQQQQHLRLFSGAVTHAEEACSSWPWDGDLAPKTPALLLSRSCGPRAFAWNCAPDADAAVVVPPIWSKRRRRRS